VEHPITEVVTGIDIVRTQLEVAWGDRVGPVVRDEPTSRGAAIECRINVPPHYDSLLAKIIKFGTTRGEVIENMMDALGSFEVGGIETTIAWDASLVASAEFLAGQIHTR
jgi:acetyl-CoA carboxylase biotin carboxylase subunit